MKIICDVCGTTFPETATHCPICGCAKSPAAKTIPGDDAQTTSAPSAAGAYAKGGRFAKNNVQRNTRTRAPEGRFSGERNRRNEPETNNKGLIAVVIILLLAIVMVVVYIGVNLLFPNAGNKGGNNETTAAVQNGGEQSIPCTGITLDFALKEFTENENSDSFLLGAKKIPENTTDTLTFTSSDPDVATVNENGLVQRGTKQGETVITVTCGSATATCRVVSTVGEPPETTPPETQTPEIPEGFVLKLETYKDSGEITLSEKSPSHKLYKEIMGVKASDIAWTSSDPSIAIVEDGKVTAVDKGNCIITAKIGDQTVTCKVIVSFIPAAPTPYELNTKDVTLYSDSGSKSFTTLELKDKNTGAKMQVEWKASKEGVVEISETGKVTACTVTSSTTVNVYTEYEGVTYICIVRVHPKES